MVIPYFIGFMLIIFMFSSVNAFFSVLFAGVVAAIIIPIIMQVGNSLNSSSSRIYYDGEDDVDYNDSRDSLHRCNDGSLDMRYSENEEYDKYNS